MAFITLDTEKLQSNYNYLDTLFAKHNIKWAVVSKILCGNKAYLSELLKLGVKEVCDSRVSNLRVIKSINPNIETLYIKPPAIRSISSIVRYADISMNTEIKTIQLLSKEAQKQGKVHKVIIMIDLGELREGVLGETFIHFYKAVFKLRNIKVVGIGTNLSCLYGVLPNPDKLVQLCLYEQLVEAKFNRKIEYISGGSTVTIPLLLQKILPKGINHLRIGEALFLGTSEANNLVFEEMHQDVFQFNAQIIELIEKPSQPSGFMGTNIEGKSFTSDSESIRKKTNRAIVDIGLLDVDQNHTSPLDKNIKIVGASSDMIVIDLGENKKNYKVGDFLEFKLDYMGLLKILNSKYVEKKIKT